MGRRRRRRRAAELTPLLDVLFILLFASLVHARYAAEGEGDTGGPAGEASARDAGPRDAAVRDAAPWDAAADALSSDAAAAWDAAVLPALDASVDASMDTGGDTGAVRARRMAAAIARGLHRWDAYVIEVSAAGYAIERAHWREGALVQRTRLHHQLLRAVPRHESDEELAYRGDAQPMHRICRIALGRAPALPVPSAPPAGVPGQDRARALVVIASEAPLAELPRALRDGLLQDAGRCFEDARGIAILVDPAADTYLDSDTDSEPDTDSDTDSDTDAEPEPDTDPGTDPGTDPDADRGAGAGPRLDTRRHPHERT